MSVLYGSDVAITALERLGIDHVAFNPGASFRGLHESLVHLDAQRPVLCLSEGTAVAVAHGFAKSAGRPMAVFLHNLVGLQSGSMGLFNAWVDQAPMVVLGGSGPADRGQRRPWIDWIHSARSQGGAVRDIVKWDDEPASVEALVDSLAVAHELATSVPRGPTYVSVDAILQEEQVAAPAGLASLAPRRGGTLTAPEADLDLLADTLLGAARPVIVADFVGRDQRAYDALVGIADLIHVEVIDLGGRHSFPTGHPGDATARRREVLRAADAVVALDVRDLGWALCDVDVADRSVRPLVGPDTQVVSVGLGMLLRRGFLERESSVNVPHTSVLADTAMALPTLLDRLRDDGRVHQRSRPAASSQSSVPPTSERPPGAITDDVLAAASFRAVRDGPWQLAHGLLRGAVRNHWQLDRWNAHLGESGGAGLGYGVGAAIGAALANDATDTLTVSLQPDGDLLYTASGLWTAANQRLAQLIIVVNNRTYGQDRMHQTVMSQMRDRPVEHARVGIDLTDPGISFTALAASQGVESFGPVVDASELDTTLSRAAGIARNEHRPVLVDVHVEG